MSRWITGLVPNWKVLGDWFDVCKCNVPCPCTFAQAPSYGDCEGVLAYHIKNGHYGETPLDGLNVLFIEDSRATPGPAKQRKLKEPSFLTRELMKSNEKPSR
jgi:hypothetical protein